MELPLAVVTPDGRRVDVVVRAVDDVTVGDVAGQLAELVGGQTPLWANGERTQPGLRLAMLAAGSVVGAGGPVADGEVPAGVLEVAVVGGPSAGRAVPLSGEVVVGREEGVAVRLADADVSRRHCSLHPDRGGAVVLDLGSRNGTIVGGMAVTGPVHIAAGDAVRVGESVLVVRVADPAGAGVEAGAAPWLRRFNRPPRITPPADGEELVLPDEPQKPTARRIPVVAVLMPVAMCAVFFAVSPTFSPFLLFMAASPILLIANVVGDRRNGHKDYRRRRAEYDATMAQVGDKLAGLVAADERTSRAALPDPAAVVAAAAGPTSRLWERRPTDADFLRLRVGLGDRPAGVRMRAGRTAAPPAIVAAKDGMAAVPTAHLVPVAVDLAADGVVGVAGPRPSSLGLVRALLAQVAALHTPADVRVVVLTGPAEVGDWQWAAWLPHLVPPGADWQCAALVGTDVGSGEARLASLLRVIQERAEQARSSLGAGAAPLPRYVVLLDGARRLRTLRGLAEVLANGPAFGVYAICLDADEASLPAECRATVVADPAVATRVEVRRPGTAPRPDVVADGLSVRLADRVARALAPFTDPAAAGESGVPDTARLLDLLGHTGPDGEAAVGPDDVLRRWSASPGGRTTAAVLGVAAGGPLEVDLRTDGPHALVAGTTGAGKSELLQTLIASLALDNRPDALTFVLVDYKGGAAFRDCARLPHCVGLVTDLDGHLVHRALVSLDAELKRREQVLGEAGAKDIEDYWRAPASAGQPPLARLVIVIDEFASLVEEVPEFVKGVVGVGMRGRSLGVHVVLATQRPGGVVSAEIRANVNLRLCLRVANPTESSDVIDAPVAARISKRTPGRAYLRSGHADLTLFQAARIGGAHGRTVSGASGPPSIFPLMLALLGEPPLLDDTGPEDDGADVATDLSCVVEAVRGAAARAGVAQVPSPWLPGLPEVVSLPGSDAAPGSTAARLTAVLGLADHPGRQAQEPLRLDAERLGNLLVVGTARSGRSTVLRTIAAGLARSSSPAQVHLYAIDFGRALGPIDALPHCGAVVPGDDTARTERLLGWLGREVGQRQKALATAGFGSVAEQRRALGDGALPAIVVLLDRYDGFLATWNERDSGRLVEAFDRLLREGPAVGVTFVVSTDRSGFTNRLGSAVEARLVLRQADRDDYALCGIPSRQAPLSQPDGRAFLLPEMVEVQVAVLGDDPSGGAQAAGVKALAAAATTRWAGVAADRRPRRLDAVPDVVSAAEVEGRRVVARPEGDAVCTIGVGGDEVGPVDVDLAEVGPGFIVAGPPRSGRSAALLAIARTLQGRALGTLALLLVAPRPSPLRDLEGEDGVEAVLTSAEQVAGGLADAIESVGGPCCVLVDDAELLGEGKAAQALEALVRSARDAGHVVVAAATTDDLLAQRFRGWLVENRRSRAGLLLAPASSVEGEALDVKLPRATDGSSWPAGRALLVHRGSWSTVQVTAP